MQVNAALAAKLATDATAIEEGGKKKKPKAEGQALLADERFQSMFKDPAFTIDEDAEEYKVLHPNAGDYNFPGMHLFLETPSSKQ